MDSYRTALNTARHSVLPWNRSISAIMGFMINTNYLQADLAGNPKRAAILTQFTDYVFGRNALNWENGYAFLTADELTHVWANWKGKQSALLLGKYNEKPAMRKQRTDICRRYNAGMCPKQGEKECKTSFGNTLRHICNKFVGQGKMCEKNHPRSDHK